jgi:anti-sigma factor RsiW
MTQPLELNVQAWLDGELSAREAAEVERLVAANPAAARLATELRWTRQALRAGEPDRPVPETREFYWSKIERAIRAPAVTPARHPASWARWWRLALPLGAAAALALFFALPAMRVEPAVAIIENHLDDVGSFSFRSESEGMTVVWIASN